MKTTNIKIGYYLVAIGIILILLDTKIILYKE